MGLGKKATNSAIDTLIYQNMGRMVHAQRMAMQLVDFSNIMELMQSYNSNRQPSEKVRLPAILMRAIALAYDHTDANGEKPYRRFSGYVSNLPWGGSWESRTIDMTMIIVREIAGVPDQACPIVFREVEDKDALTLSRMIWDLVTFPEDEIDQIRVIKRLASLPPVLVYLMFKLLRISWIKGQLVAPTSVAVMANDVLWFQGEHTSYFGLPAINPRTKQAHLEWTYDHRLGMGKAIASFLEKLKVILEQPLFLAQEMSRQI